MPLSSLLKNLSLFVKLVFVILKVQKVDEDEYKDDHEKYMTRQIQDNRQKNYEGLG